MKTTIVVPVLTAAAIVLSACKEDKAQEEKVQVPESAPAAIAVESLEDRVSYLFGYSFAKQAEKAGMQLNSDVLLAALDDVASNAELRLSEQELQSVGNAFQAVLLEKRNQAAAQKNIEVGEKYLLENAQREGVQKTESGLQYEILTRGQGKRPTETDTVKVHYHGTLLDGRVFDSSVDRGEAVDFPVNQVIAGWTEVLQLMKEGDKWRVSIPHSLAYPNGTRNIEPGSTLVFEIELLEVK